MSFRQSSKLRWAPLAALTVTIAVAAIAAGNSAAASGSHKAGLKSILFVNPLPNYPQWKLIGDCMHKQADARGVPYTETGPTGTLDANVMIQQVQQGIADKVGAIVTFPASPAFGPVLQQAHDAGIVTGTMYGGGGSAQGDFNTGVDWTSLGRQYVAALKARKGIQRVGVLAVTPTGVGKAFLDGVKAAAKATHGHVVVRAVIYTADDPAKTLDETNALLTAHPEINVLVSHMGTSTTPVVSAIKAKHLVGKVVLLGNGGNGGGIQGAKAGIVYRFLLQDLCTEGKAAANAAADLGEGKTAPKQINVLTVMASLANYKSYVAKGWM
jgi:ABC-type sugar transport system substrate-binding protein